MYFDLININMFSITYFDVLALVNFNWFVLKLNKNSYKSQSCNLIFVRNRMGLMSIY